MCSPHACTTDDHIPKALLLLTLLQRSKHSILITCWYHVTFLDTLTAVKLVSECVVNNEPVIFTSSAVAVLYSTSCHFPSTVSCLITVIRQYHYDYQPLHYQYTSNNISLHTVDLTGYSIQTKSFELMHIYCSITFNLIKCIHSITSNARARLRG